MGIITPPTLMLHSAQFRIALRDLLEEFGYPPEECERAVRTVWNKLS